MKTKHLIYMALSVALTAICAQIIIPIPFGPVPLSLSFIPVLLSGVVMRRAHAVLAQLGYLLLGAVGAPVFSGFSGGLHKLFGPTGGYLLAYPLMALVVAWYVSSRGRRFDTYLVSMTVAVLLCYLLGSVWLATVTGLGFYGALAAGVVPFVPLDAVKVMLCARVALLLDRRRLHLL